MANCAPGRDIFIVHGHDTGAEDVVALVIERVGLRAIILHEQSDAGKTLIEKVERHADVGFAVVILTPDDVGSSKIKRAKGQPHARRNVVLDLCYFLGKLGPSRVFALLKGRVDPDRYSSRSPYNHGRRWALASQARQGTQSGRHGFGHGHVSTTTGSPPSLR